MATHTGCVRCLFLALSRARARVFSLSLSLSHELHFNKRVCMGKQYSKNEEQGNSCDTSRRDTTNSKHNKHTFRWKNTDNTQRANWMSTGVTPNLESTRKSTRSDSLTTCSVRNKAFASKCVGHLPIPLESCPMSLGHVMSHANESFHM